MNFQKYPIPRLKVSGFNGASASVMYCWCGYIFRLLHRSWIFVILANLEQSDGVAASCSVNISSQSAWTSPRVIITFHICPKPPELVSSKTAVSLHSYRSNHCTRLCWVVINGLKNLEADKSNILPSLWVNKDMPEYEKDECIYSKSIPCESVNI